MHTYFAEYRQLLANDRRQFNPDDLAEFSEDLIDLVASRRIADWLEAVESGEPDSDAARSLITHMTRHFPGEVLEDHSGLCVMLMPDGSLATFRTAQV
jgi:hypothetical protein